MYQAQGAVAGPSHTWKCLDLKAQQTLRPVCGPLGGRCDRRASSVALFLPRTFKVQAISRERQGWGLSHVGRGHGAACVHGHPHQECGLVRRGHQQGQTVGLSKQGRTRDTLEWAHQAWPMPSIVLHDLSLSWSLQRRTEQGCLSDCSHPQALLLLALQGSESRRLRLWVQLCPPGRLGGVGQEALLWSSPLQKLPSHCPVGDLALHVGFMSTAHINF